MAEGERQHSRLPDWPRALKEEWAAAYVGLSVATLRKQVVLKDAPRPIWLTRGRRAWLREDLDAWLDEKSGRISGKNSKSIFLTG